MLQTCNFHLATINRQLVYRDLLCVLLVCSQEFEFFFITAPANPPSVSGQSHDSTSILVQWTFDNSTRNVLGVLQGFSVYYARQDGGSFTLITTGSDKASLMLTSLKPFTNYSVIVGAFTIAGETNSSSVVVRTQQDGKTKLQIVKTVL